MVTEKIRDFLNKESVIQLTLLKTIFGVMGFLIIFLLIYGKNYWEKQALKDKLNLLSELNHIQIQSEFLAIKNLKENVSFSKEQKINELTNLIKPLIDRSNNAVSYYDIDLDLIIKNSNKLLENKDLIIGTKEKINNSKYLSLNIPIYDKDKLSGYVWAYAPIGSDVMISFNETSILIILVLSLSVLIIFLIRKHIQQIELYINKYCKMITGNIKATEQDQILTKLPELRPVFNKIASYTDDLKKINVELELQRFKTNKILEGISDGFYLLDSNWQFEFISNKTKKLMNVENIELLGKNIWQALPQLKGSLTYQKVIEARTENKPVKWESGGFTASGNFYKYRAYPLKEGLAVFFRDITEIKRQKQELYRLEKLNLIGQLAAGISHEIRNPMTTIKGFLQIFGSKSKYKEDKESIELMISEVDRANDIISGFLSLAKANLDNDKPQNINRIIKRILPMLQADAYNNNKEVVIDLSSVPDVLVNENEIKQLILNLVRNGLEATPVPGSVIISTYEDRDKVVLVVKDHGTGIPEEIQDKIGTPFFTTKETGTGLGLAISIGIAQRHKAVFQFETGKNGTVFYIIFRAIKNEEATTK
ncbi:MAG: ATP-binding protein [Desulfitobacteriaceae bacterium]|nr:ATP-binding protein [Desulfitobacteriaceae bacterium]MDD4347411.1 ATP-binding protein [Desulfitobacteriaceae bacterium]MDD4401195.1 ATP-binding protein [Desulfitobacteriaceae bacterium]